MVCNARFNGLKIIVRGMSDKILLFGAYGMLGTALRDQFHDYTIIAPRHSDVDITQPEAVRRYITHQQPTIIVNAAAYTKVDDCEQNRTIAWRVNGEAPGYIAEGAQSVGARLIHYSTDYVFSGTKASGYNEADLPDQPVNVYGASKLAGEQAIQQATDRYIIVRTAWLYGQGGQNFVDTMLRLGREKTTIKVVNDQHGSPTYAVDLAVATKTLLEQPASTGIYHVTNAGSCTWYEFAKEIFRLAKLPVLVQPCSSTEFPRPAKRPTYSKLINTKLPALRPWQEAVAEYLLVRR